MRKTKGIVATIVSLGMVMAGTLKSFAAGLPEQQTGETATIESTASMSEEAYAAGLHEVKGDGIRLRRTASLEGAIIGLLYESEGAWVIIDGTEKEADGMVWLPVTTSSIGQNVKGWIAKDYVYQETAYSFKNIHLWMMWRRIYEHNYLY